MAYYPSEIIEKVKQIDLYTYLKNYNPDELVHFSRDTFVTKEHDSLKINNGMWFWFSQRIGGKNALDYLMKVKKFSFIEAVEDIMKKITNEPPSFIGECKKKVPIKFELPASAPNNEKAKSYLKSRGIDEDIIQECIDNGLIYQQAIVNNVVFVGYDKYYKPKYAVCRGTNKSHFVYEVGGSHKAFSFRLEAIKSSNNVHVFESPIDLLSYATLMKLDDKEWYNESLLSLGGVYQKSAEKDEMKIPIALNLFLNQNPNVKTIIFHLDNDKAGRGATLALKKQLSRRYEVIDAVPHIGKDVNDLLCYKLGLIKKTNERER